MIFIRLLTFHLDNLVGFTKGLDPTAAGRVASPTQNVSSPTTVKSPISEMLKYD